MGGAAGSPAAAEEGGTREHKQPTGPGSDTGVARDLHDAWQLAFVIVADSDLATKAVTKAFVDVAPADDTSSSPSRLELLATTLRIGLTRAAQSPDRVGSAITTALWQLPAQQRAALWLTKVNQLDTGQLGTVLGLTSINAGHVASRAAEWLDVALDHDSGPLCPEETKLADYTGRRLAPKEAAKMKAHLPDCPTCRTKVRAFEELADLKAVLIAAVPEPPSGLIVETLEHQGRTPPTNGTATLAEPAGRIPAVRPLAFCCAMLLIVGLIGMALVRPARSASDPVGSSDPRAIVPGVSATPAGAGVVVPLANLPQGTATTVAPTTTTMPAVTFPTIPAGRH